MSGTVDGQYNIGNALTGIAQMGQMGMQNALSGQQMRQNQLAIQQTQAKIVQGQDFQKAIDPATGKFDSAKYNQLLAASGDSAAFGAADASQAGVTNQQGVLANQQQQMQNSLQHFKWGGNLASAYSVNPPTLKQAQSDIAEGIAGGMADSSEGAAMLTTVPFDQPIAVQKAFWQNVALRANAQAGQIQQSLPNAVPINAGGTTILGQSNPTVAGYTGPGSTIPNSPSAEFMSTPQTVTLSNGSKFTGTPAQIAAQLGGSIPTAQIIPPGGGAPGAAPAGYGPQGLAPIGGGAPGQGGAPSQGGVPSTGGGITVAPGTEASAAQLATDQTTQFSNDVANGANNAQAMSNIYEIGAAAKGADAGPGSAREAAIGSLGSEFFGSNSSQATDEQILAKASGMLTASNMTNFGASSDAKLGAAMGITPNASMSEGGISATLAMTAGTRLYSQYKAEAAQAWKQNGGNPADPNNGYNAFQLNFQRTTSPLILSIPFMPPAQMRELQTYVHGLPRAQQAQFNAMFKASSDAGYLSAPGQ